MKKPIPFSLFAAFLGTIVLLSINSFGGSDTKVRWKLFDEGMAEARAGKKKVLLDVYTDWCGWCKKMEGNTYAHGTVASYIRDHYLTKSYKDYSSSTR